MTQPAAAPPSIVQTLIEQLTAPLTEAANAFSTKIAETLAADIEKTTKAFKEAHPAITQVTEGIVGWSTAIATSAGSVAQMSGETVAMIRNTRELKREISQILDRFPVLDGLRLRLMNVSDAIRTGNLEMLRSTDTKTKDTLATRIVTAAKAAWNAVTKAATVAVRALNAAMRANPIGLIVTAIMLLVAGLVLAYQRSTTFRNIVNAAFTMIRNVVLNVFNAIRSAVNVVWPIIVKVIQVAVMLIRGYVTVYFTIVRTVITAVWNGIRAVIGGAVSFVVRTVRGIGQVVTIVRDAFGRARSAVGEAIGGVIGFVRGLPGRVIGSLGNIGRTLYQSGRDLIEGFISGLRDMAGRVVSAIKDFVLDKIPGPIKSFLGISSPSRLMAGIGRNIGEGLVAGIDDSRDLVAQAMGRLVPAPRTAVIRPAIAGLAAATATTVAATLPPGRTRAGEQLTVNVYPRAGQSEYEIGRVAARELAWAAKH